VGFLFLFFILSDHPPGAPEFIPGFYRWYSKAKQNILSAIYLVLEYCLASQIKQIKALPSEI
jgi:hypothetical protein